MSDYPDNYGLLFRVLADATGLYATGHQVLSSQYIWKNNSLVRIVSYCLTPDKNILSVSTAHS